MKFRGIINETRQYEIEIEAENGIDALNKIKKQYEIKSKNGEFKPQEAKIEKVDFDVIKKTGLVNSGKVRAF